MIHVVVLGLDAVHLVAESAAARGKHAHGACNVADGDERRGLTDLQRQPVGLDVYGIVPRRLSHDLGAGRASAGSAA